MATPELDGLRVAILVTDGFEQVELTKPRQALEDAGARTSIIAPKSGQVQGFNHIDKGDSFPVDMTLDQANPQDFDAVLLPGGVVNADALRIEKAAQKFIQATDQAGKPIAVICHGPWLLVSAGLVKGRTLTSYKTLQDDIRNAGAKWVDQEVVRDGSWVSSRQPSDIPAFNREMLSLFGQGARGTSSQQHQGEYQKASTR
jgi:protease I